MADAKLTMNAGDWNRIIHERDAYRDLAKARALFLAAYRIGRRPSENAMQSLDKALKWLAELGIENP